MFKDLYRCCLLGDSEGLILYLNHESGNVKKIVQMRNKRGKSLLLLASSRGHPTLVKILLDNGTNINDRCPRGQTALHKACRTGNTDIVMELIRRGVDVTAKDDRKMTALHVAITKNAGREIIEILLNAGTPINGKDRHGNTALHLAARQIDYELTELILKRGGNPEVKNNVDHRPEDLAKSSDRGMLHYNTFITLLNKHRSDMRP